jgi:hypothetical protein
MKGGFTMRMCFKISGEIICVTIPELIQKFEYGPQPDPWITGGEITLNEARQLQAISTVSQLVQHFPASHQDALWSIVANTAETFSRRFPDVTFDWPNYMPGLDPTRSA